MPTLRLCLAGPMQSWGTRSRFTERDTDIEPSKSGVLGLLCAAMGVSREDWAHLEPLARLRMGVRVDQAGERRYDYHTAQEPDPGKVRSVWDTSVTRRFYLADSVFLVGLEGDNRRLLESAGNALRNPHWPLYLGRKSFVPARPVCLDPAVVDLDLLSTLKACPFLGRGEEPKAYRMVLESQRPEGSMRMDQPVSSFAQRHFGTRYVTTSMFAREVDRVPV